MPRFIGASIMGMEWAGKPFKAAAGIGIIGMGVGVSAAILRTRKREHATSGSAIRLPQTAVEAFCGAIGEISQICVLYPLETVKVKCQTDSISAALVLQRLVQQGLPAATGQLYSGFGAAALLSMLVGAVHYVSFCASKRLALQLAGQQPTGPAAPAAASAASTTEAQQGRKQQQQQQQQQHAGNLAAAAGAAAKAGAADMHSTSGSSGSGSSSSAPGEHGGTGWANMFAAVMGALATALVESPVELFRHQAQAGVAGGNLLGEMAAAVRKGGPGALWFGFLPYCLESFPYDITELGTYFQLRDKYEELATGQSNMRKVIDQVPSHVWDLAMGATAGAAAVLVSMPFDCIKTYIQVHGAEMASAAGVWGQTRAFAATGALLVRRSGPGALFVGVVPRLVQQVPSSTICWWSIEACKSALQPWTAAGPAAASGTASAL